MVEREGLRAIEIVQLRLPTNLTASAMNVDALSYDWLARRRAPGVYEVKHVYIFDRVWRYDRWENDCWLVTLAPETSRRVPCGAMRWDRSQSPRHLSRPGQRDLTPRREGRGSVLP